MALTLSDDLSRGAEPRCPYFGECGGCALQDVEYGEQVRAKEVALRELLGREVEVMPSPNPYGYRHRMDYVTAFGKTGLRKKGDGRTVVDLRECHIVQPRVSELLGHLRDWMDELGVHDYNLVTNRGDLRYMTTRHALSTDELMVILVTSRRDTTVGPLLERLGEHAQSVVWALQDRTGDDSHGDLQRVIGADMIRQHILGRTFHICPNCFFQNNLLMVDQLFSAVLEKLEGGVMDLFCGTGTITLLAADKGHEVLGVEILQENIDLAEYNAELNGIQGAAFVHDNANHFLAFYDGDVPDTLVIDPPRSGLAPKLIRKINRLAPGRIVYVSCNPKTFKMDMEQFAGYELEHVEGFDMFPQTPHVEIVSLFRKK